jgi:hypothetical protein
MIRALNTVTVCLALGLCALAGWQIQNPETFELVSVSFRERRPLLVRETAAKICRHAGALSFWVGGWGCPVEQRAGSRGFAEDFLSAQLRRDFQKEGGSSDEKWSRRG